MPSPPDIAAPAPHPRRRPRAARLPPAQRAAAIRAAALGVLAAHGIGHSNHSVVAKAAGVSVPTVFFYYRTHAELTALVLEDVRAMLLDGIVRSGAAAHADPRRAIPAMLLAFAGFIDAEPDAARVWLDWSTAIRSETWPAYQDFLAEARQVIVAMLEAGRDTAALTAGVTPQQTAQTVVGLAHMVGHMKFGGASGDSIAHAVGLLSRALFAA